MAPKLLSHGRTVTGSATPIPVTPRMRASQSKPLLSFALSSNSGQAKTLSRKSKLQTERPTINYLFTALVHFDDESFRGGQLRLQKIKGQISSCMSASNLEGARRALGEAFHTIQDFYSHSNWVETNGPILGPPIIFRGLGTGGTPPGGIASKQDKRASIVQHPTDVKTIWLITNGPAATFQ